MGFVFWQFLRNAIRFSTIFLFGSTGETLIEKSGHLNLGIPGIVCMGAFGGCVGEVWYIQSLNGGPIDIGTTLVVGILASMLFSGLMGLLYAFFTITLKTNQNVTGLAITTLGTGIFSFWGENTPFETKSLIYKAAPAFSKTFSIADNLSDFGKVFFSYGTLVYLAIVLAIVVTIIFNKTRTGLQLRAVGENPAAADAAGINVTLYKYVSNILGASIAGLGGLFYILDYLGGSIEYTVDAMGWIAVALVIFSLWRPALGILCSILFGAMLILPSYIVVSQFAYKYIIQMIPYFATILVLIIISIIGKKETQPPTALGLTYFREDR